MTNMVYHIFVIKDHMELEISKTLPLQFSSDISQILLGHWLPWWNTWLAITFLAIGQVLKILWHFEILTWESMGKPKMWNISKTANCRAKRTKIWDSGSYMYSASMLRVLLMPYSLSLVWGHSVHFAKFPMLRFSKHYILLQQFSSDFNQTSYKRHTKYHNQGLI